MRRGLAGLLLLGAAMAAGCGPVGPEVRLSPDALSWKPSMVAMLPAIAAGNVVPGGAALPEGMTRPTAPEALTALSGPLAVAFRDRSEVKVSAVMFTATDSGQRAETAARQYLESRAVDPQVSSKLGGDTGAEAVLLVALIKYGPEVDEIQQMSQNARTTVGNSALNISSTSSRAVLYFNIQFRCALIRCADGTVLWDAGIRKREKRLAVLNITQESVMKSAIDELVDTFPYARARSAPGPGR